MTDVLKTYHQELSKFLAMENEKVSFDEFMTEMNQYKLAVVLLLGMPINFVMLSAETDVVDSISKARRVQKEYTKKMEAEPSEDDHPNIVELRKRYTEILEELNDNGFL